MTAQLPLEFGHRPALTGEDFLVAPCNADAVAWLDRWPDWPAPALVVHGPRGCGKTHLALVFQGMSGARAITHDMLSKGNPLDLMGAAPAMLEALRAVQEAIAYTGASALPSDAGVDWQAVSEQVDVAIYRATNIGPGEHN